MLSLVIPTYNRPHFLGRLLRYYQELNFPHAIVVADSSDSDHLSKNRRGVDSLGTNLNIEYRSYETDIEFAEKLSDSLQYVSTPYIALSADDDFFIPSTLSRGVQFLQGHPDYALAHGDAATFRLKSSIVYGQIKQVHRYNQRTIDHASGAQRLLDHFTHYSTTWYSVQRTEQLCENYRKTVEFGIDPYFTELLPSGLALIQGKAKKLDGLYMVRQSNSTKEYAVPSYFDWVASPAWPSKYERFRDRLGEALARQDGVGLEEARDVVEEAFSNYRAALSNRIPNNSRLRKRLRQLAGTIPGARRAWRALRSLNAGGQDGISLTALMRQSSPYHADFMPIYWAITAPPTGLDAALGPCNSQ